MTSWFSRWCIVNINRQSPIRNCGHLCLPNKGLITNFNLRFRWMTLNPTKCDFPNVISLIIILFLSPTWNDYPAILESSKQQPLCIRPFLDLRCNRVMSWHMHSTTESQYYHSDCASLGVSIIPVFVYEINGLTFFLKQTVTVAR